MRSKNDILHTLKVMDINPDLISTAEHQRSELLIEVLIDIRDTLKDIMRAFIISNEAKFPK